MDGRLVKNVCAMACGDARATPGADSPDPPEDEHEAQVSGADADCDADPVAAAASVARQARPLWVATLQVYEAASGEGLSHMTGHAVWWL